MIWQGICSCGSKSRAYVVKVNLNQDVHIKECLSKRLLPFTRSLANWKILGYRQESFECERLSLQKRWRMLWKWTFFAGKIKQSDVQRLMSSINKWVRAFIRNEVYSICSLNTSKVRQIKIPNQLKSWKLMKYEESYEVPKVRQFDVCHPSSIVRFQLFLLDEFPIETLIWFDWLGKIFYW